MGLKRALVFLQRSLFSPTLSTQVFQAFLMTFVKIPEKCPRTLSFLSVSAEERGMLPWIQEHLCKAVMGWMGKHLEVTGP